MLRALTVNMKKTLKVLGYILLALVLVVVGIFFYVFREQEIKINFIPNYFNYCGKQIDPKDPEYQEIVSWLNQNKDGWVLSFVSYVPTQVYSHPAFSLNALKGSVVVSYKTDYGYPQYEKTIDHGLQLTCK